MKVGFYSCMSGMPWGGSEALWWRTARLLQNAGHDVAVNYKWWPHAAQELVELQEAGGSVWFRNEPKSFFETKKESLRKLFSSNGHEPSWLQATRPEAVLITLCLLYTSPSPRDQRGSRMPSSA